jgi:hypothetical protein
MIPIFPLDHGCSLIHESMMNLPSRAWRRSKRSNVPPEHPVPRI